MKSFKILAIVSLLACTACADGNWQSAGDRLMTTWAANLDPASVHQ